jgi:DMSO/TMAO reductase YedYZ heme-binding membrane subunit
MLSKQQFKVLSKILIFALIIGTVVVIALPKDLINVKLTYDIGKKLGSISALLFCLAITTGIINRLQNNPIFGKIANKLKPVGNYLMYSRAQIGISMFISGLAHYLLVVIVPFAKYGLEPKPQAYFIFGLLALFLSFWLAITSNTQSKKLLKTKWKMLHSLVYVIVWLIFLHVALIDISVISVLVLGYAILETYSLIYVQIQKKQTLN